MALTILSEEKSQSGEKKELSQKKKKKEEKKEEGKKEEGGSDLYAMGLQGKGPNLEVRILHPMKQAYGRNTIRRKGRRKTCRGQTRKKGGGQETGEVRCSRTDLSGTELITNNHGQIQEV